MILFFLLLEPNATECPIVDTCKIFGSSCPMCVVDDLYLDVPCWSKSGCGPTNDQAVDSPHNVLTSNAFPDNVLTNVSPNILQQINCTTPAFQSCRISCQGRDQSVAPGGPTTLRSSLRNVTSILLIFFSQIV